MAFTTSLLDSGQIYLSLTAQQRDAVWQRSQAFATPQSRWQAYLHGLTLEAILPWLQEEGLAVQCNPKALNYQWELFDGLGLQVGPERRRWVLLPGEQLDLEEWTVPQEWMDSPALLADYLVAVQVDPDGAAVRLVGFSTQARVKAQGRLDHSDRTYSLPQSAWISDLALLGLATTLAPAEAPCIDNNSVLEPPILSVEAANNLIARLGDPACLQPRLEIPFARWSALIAHGGWQQRLAEQRRNQPHPRSLVDWLRSGLSSLGLEEGWSLGAMPSPSPMPSPIPSPVPALAGVRSLATPTAQAPGLYRALTIAGQSYWLSFHELDPATHAWRVSLAPVDAAGKIPAGFVLRVLSENLQDFEGNEDRAETPQNLLYLDLQLVPGEGIVWEITPHPEGYIPEILRF